jgi:hypothetical protein
MNDERQTMKTQQMELTFDGGARFELPVPPPTRTVRAQWWFAQIQKRIQDAVRGTRPTRPEQVRLAFSRGGRDEWVTGTWMSAPAAGSRS